LARARFAIFPSRENDIPSASHLKKNESTGSRGVKNILNEKTYSRDKSGNLIPQLLMMRQSPGVSFPSHKVNALSLKNMQSNIMAGR
jgi:hypothetical protein